jgi:hypothetical protein
VVTKGVITKVFYKNNLNEFWGLYYGVGAGSLRDFHMANITYKFPSLIDRVFSTCVIEAPKSSKDLCLCHESWPLVNRHLHLVPW